MSAHNGSTGGTCSSAIHCGSQRERPSQRLDDEVCARVVTRCVEALSVERLATPERRKARRVSVERTPTLAFARRAERLTRGRRDEARQGRELARVERRDVGLQRRVPRGRARRARRVIELDAEHVQAEPTGGNLPPAGACEEIDGVVHLEIGDVVTGDSV
jgi:hypothetical protein